MRSRNRNKGQSLVEFALIFPFVFLLITGFLDVSRAVFAYASISNAVREGTRYASVNKNDLLAAETSNTNNPIVNKVISYSVGVRLFSGEVIVEPKRDTTNTNYFEKVSITVTHMFTPVTPGIKLLFGNGAGIPITVQSTMRIAQASR